MLSETSEDRESVLADLTFVLRTFYAIVEVDILMRRVAMWTRDDFGYVIVFLFGLNRLKRLMMDFEVFFKNYLEVLRRFFFGAGFRVTGLSLRGAAGST